MNAQLLPREGTLSNFTIIPAQSGTYMLYAGSDGNLFYGYEPIVAWRIETTPGANATFRSVPRPILAFGEPLDDWVGFIFESGYVSLQGATYVDLKTAQIEYQKDLASRRGG